MLQAQDIQNLVDGKKVLFKIRPESPGFVISATVKDGMLQIQVPEPGKPPVSPIFTNNYERIPDLHQEIQKTAFNMAASLVHTVVSGYEPIQNSTDKKKEGNYSPSGSIRQIHVKKALNSIIPYGDFDFSYQKGVLQGSAHLVTNWLIEQNTQPTVSPVSPKKSA
jgi:hypothetical protein